MNLLDIVGRKFSMPNYMFGRNRITFDETEFSIEELGYNNYSLRFYHRSHSVTRLAVKQFSTIDNRIKILTCGFFNIEDDCYTIIKNENGRLEMIMPESWHVPNCDLIEVKH